MPPFPLFRRPVATTPAAYVPLEGEDGRHEGRNHAEEEEVLVWAAHTRHAGGAGGQARRGDGVVAGAARLAIPPPNSSRPIPVRRPQGGSF